MPVPVDPYTGIHTVQVFGPECPQQSGDSPPIDKLPLETIEFVANLTASAPSLEDEDCERKIWNAARRLQLTAKTGLSINVVAPTGVNETSRLPVVVVGV